MAARAARVTVVAPEIARPNRQIRLSGEEGGRHCTPMVAALLTALVQLHLVPRPAHSRRGHEAGLRIRGKRAKCVLKSVGFHEAGARNASAEKA